jgi:hypothetical protein
MAWAAAQGQGAPAEAVERAAARFLTRPEVHRAPDRNESRFTTSDLIAHEEAIVRGAQARRGEGSGRLDGALVQAVLENGPLAPTPEQAAVIRGVSSSGRGVDSVEALAGTGKTVTAGLLARAYAAGGYRVLGTAPTARAVRELKEEAGIPRAWTLARLALDLDADPSGFGRGPAVLILDEAGMAGTRETARVLEHAVAAGVKVIAVGDSGQLSSVQAGGWLGSLTRRLGSYELRAVVRQRDPRERALLAHVRRGDPSEYLTEEATRAQLHIFTGDAETAAAGEQAAIAAWRNREAASPEQAVLIARDNARRARLNALAHAELRTTGRLGENVHIAGQEFAVGDRVIARRNDRLREVDNGMRGTIIAIDPAEKELLVRTDTGADRALDAAYVAEHLEHAYALTAHTIQGATVDWAGVVGRPEDFTRNWSYTALSRARDTTEIFLIDTPNEHQLDRAEIAPHHPNELDDEQTPRGRLESAMRRRTTRTSRLTASTACRAPLGPMSLCSPPPAAPTPEANHCRDRSMICAPNWASCATAWPTTRTHSATRSRPYARPGPRHSASSTRPTRVSPNSSDRRAACSGVAPAIPRHWPSNASASTPPNTKSPGPQHANKNLPPVPPTAPPAKSSTRPSMSAPPALETQLSLLRKQHLRNALGHGAPHLTATLGPLPQKSRARRTWEQAARRIEAYRFDHAITDTDNALGPPPTGTPARAHWQRAQQDIQRAQRELGRAADRGLGHQI